MNSMNLISRVALLTATVALLSFSAVAQEKKLTEKDVPAAVITAFKNAYPKATIRGYALEKEHGKTFYEIESNEGTTQRDVQYNPDGTVAEVEESIPASELPAAAQAAIRKQYPKAVISLAEKTVAGDKVGYEVSAKQGTKRISMEFDAKGKVLSSKVR
jgi:uncharacterized membrane protein YkoI